MYCLHRDEEHLVGSDPVPCPFCGFGMENERPVGSDPLETLDTEDSTTALQHVLASADETERAPGSAPSRRLQGYW